MARTLVPSLIFSLMVSIAFYITVKGSILLLPPPTPSSTPFSLLESSFLPARDVPLYFWTTLHLFIIRSAFHFFYHTSTMPSFTVARKKALHSTTPQADNGCECTTNSWGDFLPHSFKTALLKIRPFLDRSRKQRVSFFSSRNQQITRISNNFCI